MNDSVQGFVFRTIAVAVAIAVFFGVIWGLIWGWQYFKVFKAEQSGKAELAQAGWNRQIVLEEAKVANDSATLQAEARIKQESAKAEAEIIRAKGVAEANRIIADSLKGNESYLRYLWIDQIANNPNVIYVPTEASLPILEARPR